MKKKFESKKQQTLGRFAFYFNHSEIYFEFFLQFCVCHNFNSNQKIEVAATDKYKNKTRYTDSWLMAEYSDRDTSHACIHCI